jgi:predicted metal-dependent HD superfamily phosphohydrolase
LCIRPDEVAAALWFHDAIYAPRRSDNEISSAEWLVRVATDAGLATGCVARMHALVMATCHDAVPSDQDAQVLVDIDLAILGSPAWRFDAYEQQIRREYRWVPMLIYRQKRAAVLCRFLDRPHIYSTRAFVDRFEDAARANIRRSLSSLKA